MLTDIGHKLILRSSQPMKDFRRFLGIVVSFVYAGKLAASMIREGINQRCLIIFHFSYVAVRVCSSWGESLECLVAISLEGQD